MKIRQMEAMRAVVQTGTTKAAAPRILLTQSAVSKLVHQLEDELSVTLFHREGGQMVLTLEGRLIYDDVERILTIVDEMREKSRDTGAMRAGKLRIGTMPALGHGLLPRAITELQRNYPSATVIIEEQTRLEIEKQVLSGYYDLGFVTLPVQSEKLNVTELGAVSAVCVMPNDHRLVERDVVEVQDLADEYVISVDPNTLLRHRTDALFGEARVRRKLMVQTQSTQLACNLVKAGAGLAIVHPLIAHSFLPSISYRPFRPKIELNYAIVSYGRQVTRVASKLIEYTQKELNKVARA